MNGYFFRANGPNDTIGSQVRIQTGLLRSQHDRGMGMNTNRLKGREGSACFKVGDSIASLKRIIGPLPLTGEPLGRKPSIPVNEALTTRGKRHGKGKG